jgi:hypothetical protein
VRRQLAWRRLARVRPGRQANPPQDTRPGQDRGAGQGSGICTATSRRASAKPPSMTVQQAAEDPPCDDHVLVSGVPSKIGRWWARGQVPQVVAFPTGPLSARTQHPARLLRVTGTAMLEVDEAIIEPISSYCSDCGDCGGNCGVAGRPPREPRRERDQQATVVPARRRHPDLPYGQIRQPSGGTRHQAGLDSAYAPPPTVDAACAAHRGERVWPMSTDIGKSGWVAWFSPWWRPSVFQAGGCVFSGRG